MSRTPEPPAFPPAALAGALGADAIAAQSPPAAGEQFDKYTLLARLATGGMAELFVAELSGAAGFSKKVVIKRILPHVAHDSDFTRMFLDEAMTCAQISHPNVCQVFELCESAGTHFLVLEHLEGATVGELIRRCLATQQQINMRLAIGIIVQACDGLHAAHEQVDDDGANSNLVHRDVSPGNLFVTVDGIVKVLDFGIAKARWMSRKTKTGTLLGKCEYMSPEQARGGVRLDRRSDIFSLGIIAWELLCGQRLFRRESEYETLRAVLRAPIERPSKYRPSIPPALDDAIMRALERDPSERFHTAYEFRHAMTEALRKTGGPTPMCDIAPLIRNSFSEELKMQRAVLRQASQQAEVGRPARHRLSSVFPLSTEQDDPVTDKRTNDKPANELLRLPALDTMSNTEDFEPRAKANDNSPATAASAERATVVERRLPKQDAQRTHSRRQASGTQVSKAAALIAPPEPETESSLEKRTLAVALSMTLLLGAALVTAGLLLLSKKDSRKAASVASANVDAGKARTNQAAAADAGAAPKNIPASAAANAAAQAKLLRANQTGQAVVTALPNHNAESAMVGRVEILSSEPGDVYLYPEKVLLGKTPLSTTLPTGRHKLKLQVGRARGQKKYFHLKVVAGKRVSRNFDHW